MAAITASAVKELRERTGAGMMDCKKALTQTDGNMEEAVEVLRKSGAAKAVKKASRIAAEGLCCVAADGDKAAVVVEVNSETDFVAKNEQFRTYVAQVAAQALTTKAADIDSFLAEAWAQDPSKTVSEVLIEKIAIIGEKLSIRRFCKVEAAEGCVVSYVHGGGRIGVLVAGETACVSDAAKEALTNIAMQIAALNPQYISRSEISDQELAKLREITVDSALNDPASLPKPILQKLINKALADGWNEEDKKIYEEQKNNKFLFNFLSKEAAAALAALAMADKEAIASDKIFGGLVDGRVSKQLKEICLLDQTYVKAEDGKQTVAQYLEQVSKAAGTALTVKQMVRFETGEGMQKKEENFAEEVAKQMNM